MNTDELAQQIIQKVVNRLSLTHVDPATVDPDKPLSGPEIGIDSIDILELVILLEEDYGIRVESKEEGREAFSSFNRLAQFVESRRRR